MDGLPFRLLTTMTMTTAMMTMRTNPPAAPPAMTATGVVSSLLSLPAPEPLRSLLLPLDFCTLSPVVVVAVVVVVVVAVVVVSDLAESQGSFYDQSNYSP